MPPVLPALLLLPASGQHTFLSRVLRCLPKPLYKRLYLAVGRTLREDALNLKIEKILSEAGAHHLTATCKTMTPLISLTSLELARHELDLQQLRQSLFPEANIHHDLQFETQQHFFDQLSSAQIPPSTVRIIYKRTVLFEQKRKAADSLGLGLIQLDDAYKYLLRIRRLLGVGKPSSLLYGFYKYVSEITGRQLEAIFGTIVESMDPNEIEPVDMQNPDSRDAYRGFLDRVASVLPHRCYEPVARGVYMLETKRQLRGESAHGPSFTATDLQFYLHRISQALDDDLPNDFLREFKRYAGVITVEALEEARRGHYDLPVYWMNMPGEGFWSNNPLLALEKLYSAPGRGQNKIFVENLPTNANTHDLAHAFSSFGKVIATEIFEDRIRKRLDLAPPPPPKLPEPFQPDDDEYCHRVEPLPAPELVLPDDEEHIDSEVDDAIEAATVNDDAIVVVNESRRQRAGAKKTSRMKPTAVPDSRLYAAVYFDDERAVQKALSDFMRIFGVAMKDNIVHDAQSKTVFRQCRTSPPPSTLYVGNMPFSVCGYSVEEELHKLLSLCPSFPVIKTCIQTDVFNVGRGSILVQFHSHTDALAAYRSLVGRFMRGRPLKIGWILNPEVDMLNGRQRRKNLFDIKQRLKFDLIQ